MKRLLQESLRTLLTAPTKNLFVQLFRYTFSGGVAFVADFGLLYVLTDVLGVYYLLSSVVGFLAGQVITYLFSAYWIFTQRRFDNRLHEFALFVIIGVVGLLITALFMWLFTDLLHVHYLLSKVLTTIIATGWSFSARKFFLFSQKNK